MDSEANTFPWKRNLAVLWVAQVFTTLGFSFTFPFFPIFFQELGVADVERAAFWAGASGWTMGVGMGLFAPVWGIIGDRFGRKRNVVRAMVLGAIFLALSGYSQNPTQLLVSRFFVGATSGVVPTIMALVAAHTPRSRLALATGATMSALFLGTAIGPLFGGIIFDAFGMRAAFWSTAGALLGAAWLVVMLVREDFHRPEATARAVQPFIDLWRLATSKTFLPLLAVAFLVMVANLNVMPAVPGIVESIRGAETSATQSGVVFMFIGIAAAVSSLVMGWLAGRMGLRRMFIFASMVAVFTNLAPYLAGTVLTLALGMALTALFQGGLGGLVNGLIAMRTPMRQQGAAFGASQVAHSMGVAIGPLMGGTAVVTFGLRSVFLVNMGVFLAIVVVAVVLLGGQTASRAALSQEAPGETG